MILSNKQIQTVLSIADEASTAIMQIYRSDDFEVEAKADDSPLTKADKAANDVITKRLSASFDYPIVTEEDEASHAIQSDVFWLIDPLDGTKEFIKKNDEFTVNIALIKDGVPIFGVVQAPALNKTYWTNEKDQAVLTADGTDTIIRVDTVPATPKAVVSRSHMDNKTQSVLDEKQITDTVSAGSSLKFCLVAEGSAHMYPRLAPTMIWDTAAADAVVRAAGARVYNYETKQPLHYSTKQLKNPYFICTSLAD